MGIPLLQNCHDYPISSELKDSLFTPRLTLVPKHLIVINRTERKREILRKDREGCKTRWIKLRMSTNSQWIDHMELAIEPVHLQWNQI